MPNDWPGNPGRQTASDDAWLAHGGEMGERTRAFDWAKTPLGPHAGWPSHLKTALRIVLGTRYPMLIWWGRDLIHFYNDAFIPILGQRHPQALGRPAPEVWSDAWPVFGPLADAVLREGTSHWNEEKLVVTTRNGFPEEVYMTFSYGPILDDAGSVGGVFCACTEETERVLRRRRLTTLGVLGARASEGRSADEACEIAANTLSGNSRDLPFVLLYLLDAERPRLELAGVAGMDVGGPSSPERIDLNDPSAPWPFLEAMEASRGVEVAPTREMRPLPGGPWPEEAEKALVVPFEKAGHTEVAGFAVLGVSPRRPLDDTYRDFLRLVAAHVGMAVANARAQQEERRRRESEERLAAILAQLPAAVGVLGPDGNFVLGNDRMQRLVHGRMPSRDPARRGRWRAVDADKRPVPPERWPGSRALAGEAVLPGLELTFTNDEGEERWFMVSAVPTQLREGRGAIVVAQDISESKHYEAGLHESERRFRALVTATSDVVYRMSPDWREMWELKGREFIPNTDEPTSTWLDTYIHPDDQAHVQAVIDEACRTKSIFALEHRVRRVDGTLGWTFSRALPLMDDDGEILEWFGAASDITDRKRAEAQLEEESRRKDEFLAMLGHELRNPLAAIRNATELMSLAAPADDRMQRVHRILDRQSTHMTGLVDGLLEVSRIARGKIRLDRRTLDARKVLNDVLQDRRAQMKAGGLQLEEELPSQPVWVHADPVRLAQVLDNLVGNAIKFTPEGGRIRVRLAQDSEGAAFRIRDTGVGMRRETLQKMFEPFQQGDQEMARSSGGLGLGLALSQGLVELHGGTIAARSEGPGTGSEFEVRLPLADRPGAECGHEDTAEAACRRVLIVEDNEDVGESLRDLLELLGHSAELVEDGPAALEALSRREPDVVLCDIGLPGMSGYDVARAVRSSPPSRGVRLVAMTGYGQPEDRRKTREAGFDDHLTKPVDVEKLKDALGGP